MSEDWDNSGPAQTVAATPQDKPSHIMCVGWPTIKRLVAGEAVWFESLECGAVAADDLHGADIDAMLGVAQAAPVSSTEPL